MKALILIDSLEMGGAETHVEVLAYHLSQLGCDVTVASSGGSIAKRLREKGIRHIFLPTFNLPIASPSIPQSKCDKTPSDKDIGIHCSDLLSFPVAREVLKNIILFERPDVVHAHTRKTASLARSVCKMSGIPLVTTAHAMFSMRGAKRILSFWGDGTIAISEDVKEHIAQRSFFKPKTIKIIRNGVSIS